MTNGIGSRLDLSHVDKVYTLARLLVADNLQIVTSLRIRVKRSKRGVYTQVGIGRIVIRIDRSILIAEEHRELESCSAGNELMDIHVCRDVVSSCLVTCAFRNLSAHAAEAKRSMSERAIDLRRVSELCTQG